jgi:hypothetical protein
MAYLDAHTVVSCNYINISIKPSFSEDPAPADWWGNAGAYNRVSIYRNDMENPIINTQGNSVAETDTSFPFVDISTPYIGVSFIAGSASLGFGMEGLNGIWKFEPVNWAPNVAIVDNPTVGLAITCDIDCCIANKMSTYLDTTSCSCGIAKCRDKNLESIYKIYLLGEAAKAHAAELDFVEAIAAYTQAQSLCTTTYSCNCNCN